MKKHLWIFVFLLVSSSRLLVFADTRNVSTESELYTAIADPGVDEINIQADIDLTANINIQRSLTIKGEGSSSRKITATAPKMFHITPSAGKVIFENLSFSGNIISDGGIIYSESTEKIEVNNCEFKDNNHIQTLTDIDITLSGRLIHTIGNLSLSKTRFISNQVIMDYEESPISRINTITVKGDLIYSQGTVTITSCHFTDNKINYTSPDDMLNGYDPISTNMYCYYEGGLVYTPEDITIDGQSTISGNSVLIHLGVKDGNAFMRGGLFYSGQNLTTTDLAVADNQLGMSVDKERLSTQDMPLEATGVFYAGENVVLTGKTDFNNNCLQIKNLSHLHTKSDGGMIYAGSDLTLTGESEFLDNTLKLQVGSIMGEWRGGIMAVYGNLTIDGSNHIFSNDKIYNTDEHGNLISFYSMSQQAVGSMIYIPDNGGKATIKNASFKGGHAMRGGAVSSGKNVELFLQNCLFENCCSFQYGGAVYSGDYDSIFGYEGSEVVIDECKFYGNECRGLTSGINSTRTGGAAYIVGSLKITNSYFGDENDPSTGNKAYHIGALGIKTWGVAAGKNGLYMDNCHFAHNESIWLRGALSYVTASDDVTAKILNSSFTQNKVLGSSNERQSYGGAITFNNEFIPGSPPKGMIPDVHIENSTFTGNHIVESGGFNQGGGGGAIYWGSDFAEGKLSIKDCTFEKNGSNGGNGGALLLKSTGQKSTVIISGKTTFTGNGDPQETGSPHCGGAISLSSNINLILGQEDDTIAFTNNHALYYGGAIYSYLGTMQSTGCIFSNCQTPYDGSAIYNWGQLYLTNSRFFGNEAGGKGTVYIGKTSEEVMLANVLFYDNTADWGGAVMNDGKNTTIRNATITGNTANYGGGIINQSQVALPVYNSILWGNKAPSGIEYFPSYTFFYHSLVKDELFSDRVYKEADGNIQGTDENNPLFNEDKNTSLEYYALQPSSPVIDKGNDSYFDPVLPYTTTDITGKTDRFAGTIDMGAYESQGNKAPTAGFVDNGVPVCEGSTGTLYIELTGEGPWEITYEWEGAGNSRTRTVENADLENGIFALTGLNPGKYILTAVTTNGIEGTILQAEAVISSMAYPSVSSIQGPSEVKVGASITLTNETHGGVWLVNDPSVATISLRGQLTGVSEGMVEVWYVVTGSAPTHCETVVIHTVEVKEDVTPPTPPGPDPEDPDPDDPDPEWPPVIPEPDPDPDPDPDAWIIIRSGIEACYTDEFFNIVYRIQHTQKPLKYAIAFTDQSKAAGFQDIKTYQDLPDNGIISVPIPPGVRPGSYSGYVMVREKGYTEYKMYPFTLKILEGVNITQHPMSQSGKNNGEKVVLRVEAEGTNLRYQWFHNALPIPGATFATYEFIMDDDKIGSYYVEVYSDCQDTLSEEAGVSNCFSILMKWDDVMYVDNTEARFNRFQWYRDGEPLKEWGNAVYYTNPEYGLTGTYWVRAYYADGTYYQSCPVHFERLKIGIKWGNTLYASCLDDDYIRYEWYKNGKSVVDGSSVPYYQDPEGLCGSYFVRAYFADGSFHESNHLYIDKDTPSRSSDTSVTIYPTVVEKNHYVYVESNEIGCTYIGGTVELYNLSGGKVYAQRLHSSDTQIPINLPTGAYILVVTAPNGKQQTEKVMVK